MPCMALPAVGAACCFAVWIQFACTCDKHSHGIWPADCNQRSRMCGVLTHAQFCGAAASVCQRSSHSAATMLCHWRRRVRVCGFFVCACTWVCRLIQDLCGCSSLSEPAAMYMQVHRSRLLLEGLVFLVSFAVPAARPCGVAARLSRSSGLCLGGRLRFLAACAGWTTAKSVSGATQFDWHASLFVFRWAIQAYGWLVGHHHRREPLPVLHHTTCWFAAAAVLGVCRAPGRCWLLSIHPDPVSCVQTALGAGASWSWTKSG